MDSDEVLLELRFDPNAVGWVGESAQRLRNVDAEISSPTRDPMIVSALTVTGAALSVKIELIKLAQDFRARDGKSGVSLIRLNAKNEEESISFLEVSDEDIERFVVSTSTVYASSQTDRN